MDHHAQAESSKIALLEAALLEIANKGGKTVVQDGQTIEWDGLVCAMMARKALGLMLTRPLPAGTLIEYCGERATVIEDQGGACVMVNVDGFKQEWQWCFEGEECKVLA